jgi:hypothetical protein
MARAGDGTYSLPVGNPVVSGTTITTSWANSTFTDMATALTNSLDRTGTATGMTGQFKAAAGTKAAPGISWGDETASGWYRAASGDFRFSLNNTDLLLVAEDTFSLTSNGATSAAGPDFVLYRNSATPADADLIGRILFDGMNSAAAQTTYVSFNAVMEDVTDTTEDATLQIKVMSAGTLTTVLDVSPAGGTFSGGINNTPIGAVTPSTGAFTTLTASGTLGVTGATTLAALSATTGTFSSTLGVTGAATFSSTVAGAFNGTLGATTPASVAATTLSTTGAASLTNILLLGGTLPAAGNPSISLRSSDNVLYMQSGSANSVTILDSAQNTMQSTTATQHQWNISNVPKMTLDASGNLGVGVVPEAWSAGFTALEVGGFSLLSTNSNFSSSYIQSNAYYDGAWKYKTTGLASQFVQTSGFSTWSHAVSGTADAALTWIEDMRLDASGRALFGHSAAIQGTKVEISAVTDGGALALFGRASDNLSYIGFYQNGVATRTAMIQANSAAGLQFIGGSGGTLQMTLDTSGNLLVGTSTANSKIYSYQTTAGTAIRADNTQSSPTAVNFFSVFTGSSAATTSCNHFAGYADGANRILIAGNGNVTNTNGVYGSISDIKLKENITDATPKLAGINQVRVVNYNLISDPDVKQLGVVAQELEQIFPSMVDETPDRDEDGNDLGTVTKSVKYSVFVPMLIKAMQEQQAIIDSLTARIEALEGEK